MVKSSYKCVASPFPPKAAVTKAGHELPSLLVPSPSRPAPRNSQVLPVMPRVVSWHFESMVSVALDAVCLEYGFLRWCFFLPVLNQRAWRKKPNTKITHVFPPRLIYGLKGYAAAAMRRIMIMALDLDGTPTSYLQLQYVAILSHGAWWCMILPRTWIISVLPDIQSVASRGSLQAIDPLDHIVFT